MEHNPTATATATATNEKIYIDEFSELIQEILCKLPLKSLARFKCVSKTWNNKICFPGDLKANFRLLVSSSCSGIHIHYFDNREILYDICSPLLRQHMIASHLLDCCNGLLLLYPRALLLVVCNPITKQFEEIRGQFERSSGGVYASLAFDPMISPSYKVVLLNLVYRKLRVFSSQYGSWKVLDLKLEEELNLVEWDNRSVYYNGSIYKLSNKGHLVKFSIGEETRVSDRVHAIKLPSSEGKNRCIGVSNGNLYYANAGDGNLQIWMLSGCICNEYEWVLKHDVLCQAIAENDIYPCAFHPFLDMIFIGCNGGKYPNIYCYDFTNQELEPRRKLFSLKGKENYDEYLFFPFIECANHLLNCKKKL